MLRLAHALEKGMALPNPREWFGKNKAQELLVCIDNHIHSFGINHESKIAFATIMAWFQFHQEYAKKNQKNIDTDFIDLELSFKKISDKYPHIQTEPFPQAGKSILTLETIKKSLPIDIFDFFATRRSIRQFKKNTPVSSDILKQAASLAQLSPSVCNRQSGRLRVYQNKSDIQKILNLQDGNKGFGEDCSAVAIITSDLNCFYKTGERNQSYTDGGLFAMSYVLGLHGLGIGTCFLNWSMGMRTDLKMRKLLDLPPNEVIITLLAIGHIPDALEVANSPRRLLSDIYSVSTLK